MIAKSRLQDGMRSHARLTAILSGAEQSDDRGPGPADPSDRNEAPQVIVVVLVPGSARRTASNAPRVAQIYRLPFVSSDRPGDLLIPQPAGAQGTTSPLPKDILARVVRALETPIRQNRQDEDAERSREPRAHLPALTPRELDVLQLVLDGLQNKNIANALRISMRTVENHRASIMRKTGSKSLPALVKLAIAAGAALSPPPDRSRDDLRLMIGQTGECEELIRV